MVAILPHCLTTSGCHPCPQFHELHPQILQGALVVVGVRGSATGTALYPCCAPTTFTVNSSVSSDWLATVRGRAGFLVTPALLLYGTGGLAVANVKANYLFTDTFAAANESASISTTRYGWTAGVGGEYALMNGWSIKAEYLYVDLGSTSDTFIFGAVPATANRSVTEHVFRTGINYHFNSPVVAKY